MEQHSEPDYFTDLGLVDDPYPYFESLRARGPAVRLPAHKVVAVVGFDEALSVHMDIQNLSAANSVTGPIPPLPFTPEGDNIQPQIDAYRAQMPFGDDVLTQDQPIHTPLRSLMMRVFLPRRLKEIEPNIAELANQLIDEFIDQRRCEFISAYATPFAMLAIAELLGVPEEERQDFRANLDGMPALIGSGDDYVVVNPIDFRRERFRRYVEDRRREPRDGILSELANTDYPDGSQPPVEDVAKVAALLFAAGQDTTGTLLGACLRIIAERPDLQAQLRADTSLIPAFIEEVLRISGPVKSTFRLARTRTTIGGVNITPGETVMITTAAANRDPHKFEDPATFIMGRPRIKEHLSFGRGIHTCPGAALARTETRVSLECILARMDDITLDETEYDAAAGRGPIYSPTYIFRALAALHLKFTPK